VKGTNAVDIVGMLGARLEREKTGRRDLSALVTLVADLTDWDAAQDFAGALGLEGDQLEDIYTSWTRDKETAR
jgi:hypothetical protein